jgi:tetratricopeptide (TPR) repeat protein
MDLELALADVRRLTETRRYEEALRLSTELIAAHPDSTAARFRRALVFWALKQPDAAMNDLTSAISKSNGEPALFYFRGMWRIEMGLVAAGIEDMDKTITLEAQTESTYYSGSARLCRAVGYCHQGDTELALCELDGLSDSTTTYLVGRVWNVAALRHELNGT